MEIEEILKKHVGTDGAFNLDAAVKELKVEQAKTFVPKEVFNLKNDELKDLSSQVSERDQQLEASNDVDVARLQKQIDTLINESKELESQFGQQLQQVKYDALLDQELVKAGAKNPIPVKALLDLDKIKLAEDAEGFTDLGKQLENLKVTSSFLFNNVEQSDAPAYTKDFLAAEQQENFNMTRFLEGIKGGVK